MKSRFMSCNLHINQSECSEFQNIWRKPEISGNFFPFIEQSCYTALLKMRSDKTLGLERLKNWCFVKDTLKETLKSRFL